MFNSNNNKAKPWQLRWWREDQERWRWAGTIAIVFVMMGAFAYRNPDIWQNTTPPEDITAQIAAEDGRSIPEPPEDFELSDRDFHDMDGNAATAMAAPEPVTPKTVTPELAAGLAQDKPAPEGVTPASAEPEGPEDEVVAVVASPSSWQWPGLGNWTRDYGYGYDPTLGDYRFHPGRDMDLPEGAPVFAVAGGIVIQSAADSAWGGLIIIEHGGGWRSVYKGVAPEVKSGVEVFAGEAIGTVMSSPPTEKAQDSHVHFEMERDGEKQDPSQWL